MYDFQQAIDAARAVVERSENGGSSQSYAYPIVYPQKGSTITVRVLFNPASGQIVRLINRHEKIPCYRTYGIECPICKIQEQVKDLTGADPFGRTKGSRSRGICFAQFISSTVPIERSNGDTKTNLKPGDLILFMFPWSVYQQINTSIQAIAQTPTGMDQAFCHPASGLFLQVQVDNNFKYTTTQVPYMTYQTLNNDGSAMSEEQFRDLLDNMDSLNEQVIPATATEEVDKQVNEYANAIYRQYIAPQVAQQGVPVGTSPINAGQVPLPPVETPYTAPQEGIMTPPDANPIPQGAAPLPYQPAAQAVQVPPSVTPGNPVPPVNVVDNMAPSSTPVQTPPTATGYPSCMGQHKDGDPKCICCPSELMCMQPSGDMPF